MIPAPTPANELQRLAALLRLKLLDSTPEASFDALTRCLARGLSAPVALISLVDEKRQWFMCRVGLEARETPRDVSFCGHAICGTEPLVVPDALSDPRFFDNPLVVGPSNVRAYLGAPLITREGLVLGTLCAIDTKPHAWTPEDIAFARDLAIAAACLVDARAFKSELGESFEAMASLCRPRGVSLAA
ncbi:MAG: GAF domain-containing protein [Hyphomonadaceae bacterium]|nr:GAF domain-containing protein [Hyphomonadaceae bacterium]